LLTNMIKTSPCLFLPLEAKDLVIMKAFVKAGSSLETDANRGAAHLIEHLVLNNGVNEKSLHRIHELGGSLAGSTNREYTSYTLSSSGGDVSSLLNGIHDLLNFPGFSEDALRSEKKVIIKEIGLKNADPVWMRVQKIFSKLWSGTSRQHSTLSTVMELGKLTKANVNSFYNEHYRPDNIFYVIMCSLDEWKKAEKIYPSLNIIDGSDATRHLSFSHDVLHAHYFDFEENKLIRSYIVTELANATYLTEPMLDLLKEFLNQIGGVSMFTVKTNKSINALIPIITREKVNSKDLISLLQQWLGYDLSHEQFDIMKRKIRFKELKERENPYKKIDKVAERWMYHGSYDIASTILEDFNHLDYNQFIEFKNGYLKKAIEKLREFRV
jgi:Insulinase (Peptidase family M16)